MPQAWNDRGAGAAPLLAQSAVQPQRREPARDHAGEDPVPHPALSKALIASAHDRGSVVASCGGPDIHFPLADSRRLPVEQLRRMPSTARPLAAALARK